MRKKKWSTPLLTVLVKSKPEERVLVGCKGTMAGGPGDAAALCVAMPAGVCNPCSSTSGS